MLRRVYGAAGSLVGLATFYYASKEGWLAESKPHHAFSLFPSSSSSLDLKDCLVETVTGADELNANKHLMRCKMEAFVTNLQGRIIKSLQEKETDAKFVVDRWLRKEVYDKKPYTSVCFSSFNWYGSN